MHEKLLERYEESKDYWEHKDTICERYNDVLGMLALSYAKRGDYVMANDMRQRQAKVMDSIRTRENELEGLRMATIYQVNEKEAKLERKEMQNRFYLTILFLALATMVLLAVMLYILGNKNREIHYKNRMLVKYINRMNEESEVAHAQGTQGVTASEPSPAPDVTTTEADNNPLMQKHLAQLERLMNEEHVYLDSDFSHEKLQRMMGLSKNALTPVLREGLNGRLLTEYVSEKRIAHACSLLLKYPEKNVTEIASESGFYTLRNFNRVFRERMGMTASEYRKASL
jgi:AraC-like DNA-binding protein